MITLLITIPDDRPRIIKIKKIIVRTTRVIVSFYDEEEATHHPGYLGTEDTYYMGTIKGIGRTYQQTFIDTCSKVVFIKVYDPKQALIAVDKLNDKGLPFFEELRISILTDRESFKSR